MGSSGWQIGIWTATAAGPNKMRERAAMEHNGIIPEECIGEGVWIATIPTEWAKQAEDESGSEPGKLIQECNQHTIIGPGGVKWVIEVPMP